MTIAVGTRLGPYEILAPLGAGGMGEVFRARDTRLGREVAIKVLPTEFSNNADRLHRFEQEASAAGALNHPNILVVHDIGEHNSTSYVISELLEGETLRERMNGAPLGQRKTLDYALQVARGLAAAHERGIVHRDLKPENIFITLDGRAKILDFGIAKLAQADGESGQTNIPTRRVDTDPGAVMGTVGYMAPEQVRGQAVDHRADIFAFGCVLYEMLAGRRAFRGESHVETLSAIIRDDPPDLSSVSNRAISPALERLVLHCLEKTPADRFQSTRDLVFALEALSGSHASSDSTPTVIASIPERPKRGERFVWIAVSALLLISTLALALLYFKRPAAEQEAPVATRFYITLPEKTDMRGTFAVSPDGRRVALRGISGGKVTLWVRPLDSLEAQPLAGTDEATYPFWSPDSRFIGFFANGKLKKVEATGGPVQTLCDAPAGRGGSWNADGLIIFSPGDSQPILKVSAAGGAPVPLTTRDQSRGELSHYHPYFLTDGRHFLYLVISNQLEHTGIHVGSLDSPKSKFLVKTAVNAAYAPPGYLLYVQDRTLVAQNFDADRLELTGEPTSITGEPTPIVEGIDRLGGGSRFALFSVSRTGVLVYRSGSSDSSHLIWFDRKGEQLGTIGQVGSSYAVPWFSPDERRVAVSGSAPDSGSGDIWVIELARGTPTRFTFDPAPDMNPVWSPDGSTIIFTSERDGSGNIYRKPASGAVAEEVLIKSEATKIANDWSADGKFILYQELSPQSLFDLWIFPLDGERKPFPFLQTPFDERHARFSPDGKWIAYASNESGMWQVYVQTFPASGGKWQISNAGGGQPQWSSDGREIFYVSADRKLMSAEVKASGSTFEVAEPRVLFEMRIQSVGLPGPRNFFAVTRDSQRFLVNSLSADNKFRLTTVVLNWTADLKR